MLYSFCICGGFMAEKFSTPLERWYAANRENPGLDDALRLLLGHALVGIFRRHFPDFPVFSPEKAVSLAQRLPIRAFPANFGGWISSPSKFAPEVLRFCENSGAFVFPPGVNLSLASGTVDLRGVRCPLGSVRARLVMRGLDSGEELNILLDDGEPIENVPRALVEDGEKILFREKKTDYWKIRVRKREATK